MNKFLSLGGEALSPVYHDFKRSTNILVFECICREGISYIFHDVYVGIAVSFLGAGVHHQC